MKDMLNELKKLDVDIDVPKDFKENVMQRIKEIETQKKKEKKTRHITRYIIPYISSAAVIVLAIIVGINSDSKKNTSKSQMAAQDMVMYSASAESNNAPNSILNTGLNIKSDNSNDLATGTSDLKSSEMDSQAENKRGTVEKIFNEVIEDVAESSKDMQKNDMSSKQEINSAIKVSDIKYDMLNAENEDQESILDSTDITDGLISPDLLNVELGFNDNGELIKTIHEVLENNKVEIILETEKYILVNETKEKIKEIIEQENLQYEIAISEQENFIKIECKNDLKE